MSSVLDKLKRGGQDLPPRVILAGPEGIGKTTFAAHAPEPLFIAPENGLMGMDHIAHLEPSSFQEILDLVDELIKAPEIQFKTIVIDTADWLERCIHRFICDRDNKSDVEAYGYGKGYKIAEGELVKLLGKLDTLRASKKVGILFLAHVQIRTFTDPMGTSWDRYEPKGHKGFSGILREWPDACLFAVYEVFKSRERGEQREKVVGGGRIVHTQWSPGWDAKNRLNLPETINLDYAEFAQAVEANSPSVLRRRVASLMSSAVFDSATQRNAWEKVRFETLTADKLRDAITKLEAKQPKAA